MENKQTIFIRTFGDSPIIRILDYLLMGRGLDYSMSDITRNSNVSWTTLNRIWNNLLKTGLIKPTRIIGKAKLFTLNMENPVVNKLIEIHNQLLVQETENYFNDQRIAIEVPH